MLLEIRPEEQAHVRTLLNAAVECIGGLLVRERIGAVNMGAPQLLALAADLDRRVAELKEEPAPDNPA